MLDAKDPARRRELAALLAESGHAVVDGTAALWEVALVDLAPGEEPPEVGGGRPLVLLADHSTRRRRVRLRVFGAAEERSGAAGRGGGRWPRRWGSWFGCRAPPSLRRRPAPGFARDDPGAPLLTPREVEILALVGDGASNKAVARRLGISAHTVKFHLEAVFRKLGVTTRAEAVARGLRQRLIEM